MPIACTRVGRATETGEEAGSGSRARRTDRRWVREGVAPRQNGHAPAGRPRWPTAGRLEPHAPGRHSRPPDRRMDGPIMTRQVFCSGRGNTPVSPHCSRGGCTLPREGGGGGGGVSHCRPVTTPSAAPRRPAEPRRTGTDQRSTPAAAAMWGLSHFFCGRVTQVRPAVGVNDTGSSRGAAPVTAALPAWSAVDETGPDRAPTVTVTGPGVARCVPDTQEPQRSPDNLR